MSTPDGRFTIVFNGEIYNYQELRQKYFADAVFASGTDSEVLLHLLAKRGVEALSLVRGMFALALWVDEKEVLLLARDPFSKKPLYYAERDGMLLFASEAKALLAHPAVKPVLDRAAAVKYLLYEYVPAPATGFAGIREVLMGSYVTVQQAELTTSRYWQPQFKPKTRLTERTALRKLDGLLRQAVERRMVADVPVGLLLSGGLDSTTIAWYMREVSGTKQLHSFSMAFEEASFDESSYAAAAAKAFDFEHHTETFTVEAFKRTLEEIVGLVDVPLGDAS